MSEDYRATTLLLIRHGQARAKDGSYDELTPLSKLGRRQALAVSRAVLRGPAPVAVVYTSPYARAVETSAPLCEALRLAAVLDSRLAEFELGCSSLDIVQQRPDLMIWRPEHRGAEHGETLAQFSARVAAFCEEVAERHLGATVIVVAHAGTIEAAIRWLLGLSPTSPWQHEFELPNASITEIEFWPCGRTRGGAPRYAVFRRVGDVTHLGNLGSDL